MQIISCKKCGVKTPLNKKEMCKACAYPSCKNHPGVTAVKHTDICKACGGLAEYQRLEHIRAARRRIDSTQVF